jgi:hypothetical protein
MIYTSNIMSKHDIINKQSYINIIKYVTQNLTSKHINVKNNVQLDIKYLTDIGIKIRYIIKI